MDVVSYLDEWDDDFGFVPKKPSRPLVGEAGSAERVQELARRVANGESPWARGEGVGDRYIDDYDWVMERDKHETRIYSRCRRWLYRRWRFWGNGSRTICFVGKYPSESQWRKQLAVAKFLKCDGCESVNLFAWSLPEPPHDGASEVGASCDSHISQAVMASSCTVICWGDGGYRGKYVAKAISRRVGVDGVRFFGIDSDGNPLPSGTGRDLVRVREFFNDDGE